MSISKFTSKIEKYEKVNSGMLIRDVKLMAVGTWHAGNAILPMRYGQSVLEKYATKWLDNSVWSTHDSARSVTTKIGHVEKMRYEDEACIGDVVLHGETQESKDVIKLIGTKNIDSVSSEIAVMKSQYCEKNDYDNAEEIAFVGLAIVSSGACEVCKLYGDAAMDKSEMEAKLVELSTQITEIVEKFDALEIPEPTDVTPITTELGEHKGIVELLTARIKVLEDAPVQKLQGAAKTEDKIVNPFK